MLEIPVHFDEFLNQRKATSFLKLRLDPEGFLPDAALAMGRSIAISGRIAGPDEAVSGFMRKYGCHPQSHTCAALVLTGQAMAYYELAGKRIYEASPGLAQRLTNTELRGVTTDDLRLPYMAIYIAVPEAAGLFSSSFNSEANSFREIAIDGLYILEASGAEFGGDRIWIISSMSARAPRDGYVSLGMTWVVPLANGRPIEAVLEEEFRADDGLKEQAAYAEHIFRWAMNAVMYATLPDADREELILNPAAEDLRQKIELEQGPKRKKRLEQQYCSMDLRRRIYLGRRVKHLEWPEDQQGDPAAKRIVRTLVQGHWRNQACGRGWLERRMKWIEPFWRGPTDAPESNPTRVMVMPG